MKSRLLNKTLHIFIYIIYFILVLHYFKKLFDRITEKLSSAGPSSSNSSSLNLTLAAQHVWLKTFEKALALLRIIAYNKKNWLPKLLIHSLFPTIIKLTKVFYTIILFLIILINPANLFIIL